MKANDYSRMPKGMIFGSSAACAGLAIGVAFLWALGSGTLVTVMAIVCTLGIGGDKCNSFLRVAGEG